MSLEPVAYEHAGVRCCRNEMGLWLFDRPPAQGSSWERYFTHAEAEKVAHTSTLSIIEQKDIIKTGIIRMLKFAPVYTGDLRERKYHATATR